MCTDYRVSDPPPVDDSEMNVFTEKDSSGCINYRQGRPALLVSSTSWTGQLSVDGDFLSSFISWHVLSYLFTCFSYMHKQLYSVARFFCE